MITRAASHVAASAVALQTDGRTGPAAPAVGAATRRDFEATLLEVLVDQALPKGQSTFGHGVAGNFARSQLCHELGKAVAAKGTLGIARLLEGVQIAPGHSVAL